MECLLEKPRALMAASARRALGVLFPDRVEPIPGAGEDEMREMGCGSD
jgi:hypothetical protein